LEIRQQQIDSVRVIAENNFQNGEQDLVLEQGAKRRRSLQGLDKLSNKAPETKTLEGQTRDLLLPGFVGRHSRDLSDIGLRLSPCLKAKSLLSIRKFFWAITLEPI
jgi:hypothetical protein